MSAFMVSDTTIHDVVKLIRTVSPDVDLTFSPAELGQSLRDMNAAAMDARYQDRWDRSEEAPKYKGYRDSLAAPDPVQLIKSTDCFLYQCTEGEVDESKLFGLVKLCRDRFATDYMRKIDGAHDYARREYARMNESRRPGVATAPPSLATLVTYTAAYDKAAWGRN